MEAFKVKLTSFLLLSLLLSLAEVSFLCLLPVVEEEHVPFLFSRSHNGG